MISNSSILRLNFILSQWRNSDILSNSYIKVSYINSYTLRFIAEFTLKFVNGTIYKFFWNAILKRKTFANLFWLLKTICNLQQSRIPLRDFFKLSSSLYDNGVEGKEELRTKAS